METEIKTETGLMAHVTDSRVIIGDGYDIINLYFSEAIQLRDFLNQLNLGEK